MERRWSVLFHSACLAVGLLGLSHCVRAESVFYGPLGVVRDTASPQPVVETFTLADVEGDFTLVVHNGNVATGADRVTSAVVYLNGEALLTTNEFSKQVAILEVPVVLQPSNELSVDPLYESSVAFLTTLLASDKR